MFFSIIIKTSQFKNDFPVRGRKLAKKRRDARLHVFKNDFPVRGQFYFSGEMPMSFVYLTESGTKLSKRGGHYLVTREGETVLEIPQATLEGLVVMNSVQVTSDVMADLMKRGISVHWISAQGKNLGRLVSSDCVHVERQIRQVELLHSSLALALQKKVIAAKLHNQQVLLRRYNRNADVMEVRQTVEKIHQMERKIDACTGTTKIMGYEGMAGKLYFSALGQLVPKDFAFLKRSRRPPEDAFNAMLSFGYTLLTHELYTDILNEGLHPYIGFLHEPKNHHAALASDLVEPWRPVVVDAVVMALVNKKMMHLDDFRLGKDGKGVYLESAGRKKFLQAYEKKLHATVNKTYSYRHAAAMMTTAYAHALMTGDATGFQPLLMR